MSFWHDFLARRSAEKPGNPPVSVERLTAPPGPSVSLPSVFTPPPAPPAVKLRPLTDRDRYRLMLRYSLTAAQIARLPLDIAHILLALPR